jgi:hypothetical protein
MSIVICPGIHAPELTQEWLEGLESLSSNGSKFSNSRNILVVPTQNYATLSAFHILQFLQANQGRPPESPIVFISFSAGVVGAIGAAWGWQILGGKVKALIAVDGWGVPLFGHFPLHRLSHDYFTHWSSASLGSGQDSFYADPPVEHLELWRSPQTVVGWWVNSDGGTQSRIYLTAAQFLTMLLKRYGELE